MKKILMMIAMLFVYYEAKASQENDSKNYPQNSDVKNNYLTKTSSVKSSENSSCASIDSDCLYWSMQSAWGNLNDYSKRNDIKDLESAISSLYAYIINNGDQNTFEYLRVLWRICYEHHEHMNKELKALLKINENYKKYGLKQLKIAAKQDEEVKFYLQYCKS